MAIQPTGRLAGYRRSGAGGQAEMTSKLGLKLPSQKVSTFDGFALVGFPLMNLQEDLEELGSPDLLREFGTCGEVWCPVGLTV